MKILRTPPLLVFLLVITVGTGAAISESTSRPAVGGPHTPVTPCVED